MRGRFFVLVGAAVAFGLVAAWIKDPGSSGIGDAAQARSALGNLSAPWLLLPFAAGWPARRVPAGAVSGLVATVSALSAFYLVNALVVDLGHHGLVADLRLELTANRYYFAAGLVSGPVCGAAAVFVRRARSVRLSILAGALMLAEPIVLATLGELPIPARVPLLSGWSAGLGIADRIQLLVYAGEAVIGLALLAGAGRLIPRIAPRPGRAG